MSRLTKLIVWWVKGGVFEAVGLNSGHVSNQGAVLGICGSEFRMSR